MGNENIISDFGEGTIADKGMNLALVRKWSPLLEGVEGKHQRAVLARMFENQAAHLRSKAVLTEQTKSADAGPFTKFIFPLLRRVYPNLIAQDIVSIQPMNAPVGAVFFFNLVYASQKGAVNAGDLFSRDFDRYYSSEFINGEKIGDGDGASTVFANTLAYTPIKNVAGSVSGEMFKVTYTIGATDYEGFADASGTITGTNITSGSVNFSTGAVNLVFGTAPDNSTVVAAKYEYAGEANSKIAQANMQVSMLEVKAHSRKLKALVSSEAAEDLRAFHNIDADEELTSHIADEIALEIDREILMDISDQATGGSVSWDRQVPSGAEEVGHIRTFITQLSKVSNAVHKSSLRLPANWAVVSPELGSVIEQLQTHADYRHNVDGQVEPGLPLPQGHFGIYPMGTLKNRWRIYVDPYMDPIENVIVGFKGRSFMDAGFAWAPYIPLQVTAPFLDPGDFTIRKGLRTRYAKKMLRPEYYGKMTIQNL